MWHKPVADLGGPREPGPPLFWFKKKSQKEEKPTRQANLFPIPHPLSSRSGSATVN